MADDGHSEGPRGSSGEHWVPLLRTGDSYPRNRHIHWSAEDAAPAAGDELGGHGEQPESQSAELGKPGLAGLQGLLRDRFLSGFIR